MDTYPWTDDSSLLHQLRDDLFGDVDRHGKPDTLSTNNRCCINPNNLSTQIDKRSARVAQVNSRISLDEGKSDALGDSGKILLIPETIPRVKVCSKPRGLPIAKTSSPIWMASESPKVAVDRPSGGRGIRKTAKSRMGSTPTSFATTFFPSSRVTMMSCCPKTT